MEESERERVIRETENRCNEQTLGAEAQRCQHGWRGSVPENGRQIADRCPACGGQLFIGSGGWLTCSRVPGRDGSRGCPEPGPFRHYEGRLAKWRRLAGLQHMGWPALTAEQREEWKALCDDLGFHLRAAASPPPDDIESEVGVADAERPKTPHVDSGIRCLVLHHDADTGERMPQCIVCQHCGRDIQPHRMDQLCQARVAPTIHLHGDTYADVPPAGIDRGFWIESRARAIAGPNATEKVWDAARAQAEREWNTRRAAKGEADRQDDCGVGPATIERLRRKVEEDERRLARLDGLVEVLRGEVRTVEGSALIYMAEGDEERGRETWRFAKKLRAALGSDGPPFDCADDALDVVGSLADAAELRARLDRNMPPSPTPDELELWGVTSPDQAREFGRRRLAEMALRDHSASFVHDNPPPESAAPVGAPCAFSGGAHVWSVPVERHGQLRTECVCGEQRVSGEVLDAARIARGMVTLREAREIALGQLDATEKRLADEREREARESDALDDLDAAAKRIGTCAGGGEHTWRRSTRTSIGTTHFCESCAALRWEANAPPPESIDLGEFAVFRSEADHVAFHGARRTCGVWIDKWICQGTEMPPVGSRWRLRAERITEEEATR